MVVGAHKHSYNTLYSMKGNLISKKVVIANLKKNFIRVIIELMKYPKISSRKQRQMVKTMRD